jgi:hypothetical protein
VSETKSFIVVLAVVAFIIWVASVLMQPRYPQATRIFPQVVSCVNQNPDHPTSDPRWQPTLRVKVEPVRDLDESGSIGCLGAASTTTTVTSDDPRRGLFTGVRGEAV